jgi:hypothetical protein
MLHVVVRRVVVVDAIGSGLADVGALEIMSEIGRVKRRLELSPRFSLISCQREHAERARERLMYLLLVLTLERLEDMCARFRVMDERIPLRAMH